MARAGLSRDAVVDLALRIIDEEGGAALTLAAVAGRAGVATPSLYKHVRNLAELNTLVSVRVMDELADRLREAVLGRSGDEALRACMAAYRDYVTGNPGRYAAVIQAARPGQDDVAKAGGRVVDIMLATFRGYGLEGADALHAVRCLRSAVHGFAVLESGGAFGLPLDLDASYALLADMIISGLPSPARQR
ncbi:MULTISPECIES: TetR-like C-terminal domain-containing protein [unclassified Nonomuraea]|uniref:TetR/AcrR family transcriptional regulator n=1 Tax=unclassified Nonomuraea TaxID=2593643 RepID=UPI0033F2CACE